MAAKHQFIDIEIPPELKPGMRERLAELVIDFIAQRSEQGLDKENKPFKKYSESYTKSLDFKNAGKSAGDVDLTLSGDMLASMELLRHGRGTIRVGFEKGSEENARADGNIRGTYGQSSPIRGKKRDFLGIKKRALKDLINEVIEEFDG